MNTEDDSPNLALDLLRQFYRDIPSALVGNLLSAVILIAVMMGNIPDQSLAIWFSCLMITIIWRFVLYKRFQATPNLNHTSWKITAITAMAFTGIVWGALPPMVVMYGSSVHLTFLILILAGLTAGALSSGAAFRLAFFLFVTPPILTLFVIVLLRGGVDYYGFAALIPIYLALLLRSNNEYHRILCNALTLHHSNIELVQQTETANNNLKSEMIKQKAISKRLADSEATFRSLAESSSSIILVYGKARKILYLNPALESLLGFDAKTIIDKPFGHFVHPDDRDLIIDRADRRLQGEEIPSHYQIRVIDASNKVHWIDMSVALSTYQGKAAAITTGIDITHLKEAEDQLISEKEKAEYASKAKSEFLSSMSHELRTPMNAVLGFAQLLSSDTEHPLTDDQKDAVDTIIESGNYLLLLINDVLDLAKVEAGKTELVIETVDVIDLIARNCALIKSQADNASITIVNTASDLPPVMITADQRKLLQVLLNISSNAIKYNSEHGSVQFTCHSTENDKVRISIIDTGAGVEQNDFPKLFEPFNRLNKANSTIPGTGIGLTICKQLVELMGGEIGVSRNEDKGLTFWIEFDKA